MMKGIGHTAFIIGALIVCAMLAVSCGSNAPPTDPGFEEPGLLEAETVERDTAAINEPFPVTDLDFRVEDEILFLDWSYSIPGDTNQDLSVNGLDVFLLASQFGETSSWMGQDRTSNEADCADANRDGKVGALDLFSISVNFGCSVDTFCVYRSLNTPKFTSGDLIDWVPAAVLEAVEKPSCSMGRTTNLGALGVHPHNAMVRARKGEVTEDSKVANYPGFTGLITAEGDPLAQVPNFFDFSVEYVGGTAPHEVLWQFGDGFTSEKIELTHDFVSSGPFRPKVTITDAAGWELVLEAAVDINPAPKVHRLVMEGDGSLWLVNSDGTNPAAIGESAVTEITRMLLSADSGTLVHGEGNSLRVVATDTGESWTLPGEFKTSSGWTMTHDGLTVCATGKDENQYLVSSDGSRLELIYSAGAKWSSLIAGNGSLIFALGRGELPGEFVQFHTIMLPALEDEVVFTLPSSSWSFRPKCLSADGSLVVGSLIIDGHDFTGELYLFDGSTHPIVPITLDEHEIGAPSCDGEGRKLAFIAMDSGFEDYICVARTDGSVPPRSISSALLAAVPRLSVDGSLIALNGLSPVSPRYQTITVSADGRRLTRLSKDLGFAKSLNVAVPGAGFSY